ncbi:MAG TPA: hypothetical protein VMT77_11485, partial [Gemmatimonadales bacterium]|nr:hypothetical protein [Gemmatimonadales bacterium]
SVALDPSGLGAGDYRDTLVFSVAGPAIVPVKVPVEFRVTGCVPTALVSGAVVSDSLTTADCGAPHRSGRVAKLYAFTGNANDSVSLHLASAAFGAYLVLDSAAQAGVPSFVESSACRPGQTGACLTYVRLPQTGSYVVEATSVGAGATGPFALSFTGPRPPAAPDSLAQLTFDGVTTVPAGGAVTQDSVLLRAVLADPDTDSVRVEVEVRAVGTSFTGTATAAGAFGPSGTRGSVLVTGLANFASYHWQARAVDRTGRASAWVAFGTGGADFRVVVPQPPVAPASLAQLRSDGVTPIGVDSVTDQSTVLFQALVNDPDSGDVVRLEVEVKPVGTAFVDTATVSSTPAPRGTVATATITGLADGTGYHWQARAVDGTGRASAWVPFGGNAETQPDFRVALAATQLAVLTQPTNVSAGSAIAPAVRVAVQDASGNTIGSFTGTVTVAIGTNPAGGTLSGATSAAAVAGVATFGNLRLDRTGSGYTLLFSYGAIAATSTPFNVTPGAATALAFTGQPGNATAGVALAPAIQVTARDSLGNVATGFTGTVTLALANDPTNDTLTGTTTAAAAAGVAQFSNAIVRRAGTGYTLAASANGLTGATSGAFNVSAATGQKLAITTQPPATAVSGVALMRQPAIQIEDSTGNPVTVGAQGVVVTAFIDSGPAGATLANATATTLSTGLATFVDLTLTGTVGRYVLGFSAQGYQGAVSGAVVLSAGAATRLVIATEPSGFAQSGVPFVQQPVVQLQDASGNAVPQSGDTVTASLASGTGTLGGTRSVLTNASGAAVFTDLSISGSTGQRTLGFAATGLAGATSSGVTVSAGVATQIAKFAGDSQTAAVGGAVPVPPAVIVRDASNNPVAGVGVTFAVAGGGGSVTPSAVATDASGVAAVASWTLGATAGANSLTASAAGLAGSPVTFHATGVPGSASPAKS